MLQNQTFCYPYFYGNKESEMTLFRSYGSYPPPLCENLHLNFWVHFGFFLLASSIKGTILLASKRRWLTLLESKTIAMSNEVLNIGICSMRENDCYVEQCFVVVALCEQTNRSMHAIGPTFYYP